ncbi:hypothetical protein H6761_04290 [Candidatus Nomurabacteria bacterium]|nr:hypothetical protein [Candidatus Nomurabacteria bacterium]
MSIENPNIHQEQEFDEVCQFCGKPTGTKTSIEHSHGTCPECLPKYLKELEDFKEQRRLEKED